MRKFKMDELARFLEKLPKKVLMNIMVKSLDRMQYYDLGSTEFCILFSIGAEFVEKEYGSGNGNWKLPSLKKVIEDNQTIIS